MTNYKKIHTVNQNTWLFYLMICCVLHLVACSTNRSNVHNQAISSPSLHGNWQMLAIRFVDGRVMLGEYMGNPHYEFTLSGWRVKRLYTELAPSPDSVKYTFKGDSIFYIGKNYPSMHVSWHTPDTLCLSNHKLSLSLIHI